MRKREARPILNASIGELCVMIQHERLSQKMINRMVVVLREASCAALAMKRSIDNEPMTADRLRGAE